MQALSMKLKGRGTEPTQMKSKFMTNADCAADDATGNKSAEFLAMPQPRAKEEQARHVLFFLKL